MGLILIRYVIPAIVALVGFGLLIHDPSNADGAAGIIGAGVSISFFSWLLRYGFDGDHDRDREAYARAYYTEHGRWPSKQQTDSQTPKPQ